MSKINFDNFDIVVKEAKELAIKKNALYGVDNLLIFNGFGILVRINDKVSRLNNLLNPMVKKLVHTCNKCELYGECDHQGVYKKDGKWCYDNRLKPETIDIEHEKLNDILLDLINYSLYLYLFKNNLLF